jgi:OmpA-OmpF porin, OOP family
MISDGFRSLTIIGGVGLLAFSLVACDDRQLAREADPSPTTQSAAVDSSNVPPPPAPEPPPPLAEPMPHYNVHFAVGSAELSDAAMDTLNAALDYLRANPAMHVKLAGYTDLSGSPELNRRLAERRVENTARFFAEHGLERSRLSTIAVGEAEPGLAPAGENPETWNRRVEIEFSVRPNT